MKNSAKLGWQLFALTVPLMVLPAGLLAPFAVLGGVIRSDQLLPLLA